MLDRIYFLDPKKWEFIADMIETPEAFFREVVPTKNLEPVVRKFDTGAIRDVDVNKFDFEGFLSPIVIERFAAYMHKNRHLRDGSVRDSDNWQKGIPLTAYMKSGWRHFFDWWKLHRGLQAQADIEDTLCAVIFNAQGYLHEVLKNKEAK